MIRPTESQTTQWEEKGYLVFEDAIQGNELKQLQNVFDYWAEECKPAWLDRVEAGEAAASFYDISDPFDKDEIFVDLIDHPSYYGSLMAFTDDDLILLGPQVPHRPAGPRLLFRLAPRCTAQ